jgi:hypothetical protein
VKLLKIVQPGLQWRVHSCLWGKQRRPLRLRAAGWVAAPQQEDLQSQQLQQASNAAPTSSKEHALQRAAVQLLAGIDLLEQQLHVLTHVVLQGNTHPAGSLFLEPGSSHHSLIHSMEHACCMQDLRLLMLQGSHQTCANKG